VAITAISALGLMACTITLPYLTRRVIDDVLNGRQQDALLPLVIIVIVIGVIRALFAVIRRILAGHVSLSVEFDLTGCSRTCNGSRSDTSTACRWAS